MRWYGSFWNWSNYDQDLIGSTPLHFAVDVDRPECAQLLLILGLQVVRCFCDIFIVVQTLLLCLKDLKPWHWQLLLGSEFVRMRHHALIDSTISMCKSVSDLAISLIRWGRTRPIRTSGTTLDAPPMRCEMACSSERVSMRISYKV